MKKILKLFLSFSILFYFSQTNAATIDHFTVSFWSDSTSINKAVDLIIEAKDKNENTVTDYVWKIFIIAEDDPKATLPNDLVDNAYTFKTSDEWVVKFENALIFKNTWKQTITVISADDQTILWTWNINVSWEASSDTWVVDIKIISPEDWSIIPTDSVSVSWETQKNHKVKIKLNWTVVDEVNSNDSWTFESKLTSLESWNISIIASLVDSDDVELASSNEVRISIQNDSPTFNSIKILPWTSVNSEESLEIEVSATPLLKEVSVTINDEIIKLIEQKEGIYTWTTLAPQDEWTYDVDVKLINDLWNQTNKRPATKLEVLPLTLTWATDPIISQVCSGSTSSWTVDCPDCDEICATKYSAKKIYKISNLQLTKLKTKSILSWDPIAEAVWYNIYKQQEWNKLILVDTVKEARYEVNIVWKEIKYEDFVVEAVISENWNIVKWELSEVTKIQTWPKELLIFLVLSMILWYFITTYKRKNG